MLLEVPAVTALDADADAKELAGITSRLRAALGDDRGRLRVADALALAGFDRPSYQRSALVGQAMRDLGWARKRTRLAGKLVYAYVRGSRLERECVLDVERGADDQLVVVRKEP